MSASQAQAQTQTAQPESNQTVLHSSNRLMIAVVLALTFAAYIGTIRYQFVYDDRNQIVENSFIKSWQNVPGYFTGQVWQTIYPNMPGNYYRPAFLLWRTLLTFSLGLLSFKQLKRGNILTILLYAAGFLALLSGPFGQPTSLGFCVFLCGICLASANKKAVDSETERTQPALPARPQVARRSHFAEQLHRPSVAPRESDDSAHW